MNLPVNLNKIDTPLLPVIVIVGPTAVGKTSLSLKLAQKYNAEIVSADSRQIYTSMDIGTAKPTVKEMAGITHHFIDFTNPGTEFSAGEFGIKAREKILEIRKDNKNVIVVGGSGLYIRALLYGMIKFDQKDDSVREELTKRLKSEGLAKLYSELEKVDPELANRFSVNDTQRILRGLEVFLISGKKLSDLQKENEIPAPFDFIQIGILMDREELYQRINKRVDEMIKSGLEDEVKKLLTKGYDKTNALNAVGYKEVVSYINNEISFDEMVELIKRNTRRFAKRQMTWFNKDKNIIWLKAPVEQQKLEDTLNLTNRP
ncbi:MAG: tRNA (adenosine(37)-N6)-dimethylallyltransferase MiaA [Calditrichaeota bacterium]|nr:MAG: tRNA (adenosine(37)-N6)-dimethylallyltransferase MiaA [Calditrichota bacterium]MBL1204371.1 tRNA (adenosine(37)-N6)-dimethylallyltransferase MiaA [Calditrichota bacterium]NOG44200.1 tRNA (adenosine(37)-N6)-dimethylallyltransferase MiaA [Calditrichota bacterium]